MAWRVRQLQSVWIAAAAVVACCGVLPKMGVFALRAADAGESPSPAVATPATNPSTAPSADNPTTQPDIPRRGRNRDAEARKLLDFLVSEYTDLLAKARDRVTRSLVVVRLARVPKPEVTPILMDVLKNDKDPLVKMVAWQSILARASGLSEDEFKQWVDLTVPMLERTSFRGELRVPLCQMLAMVPPSPKAKQMFVTIFDSTNVEDVEDWQTLEALGHLARDWRQADLMEHLMNRVTVLNDAYRADAVLHYAGVPLPLLQANASAGSQKMQQIAAAAYVDWWRVERTNWLAPNAGAAGNRNGSGKGAATTTATEAAPVLGDYRKLQAQYVPAVALDRPIDLDDRSWYRDLELRQPDLRNFDVGLMVDVTGSMGGVLTWLRSDVWRMTRAFELVCAEPRVGITFYRDFGDTFVTRTLPLGTRTTDLARALQNMTAAGGGDIPEAIREALIDCLGKNHWSQKPRAPKALILIGDAPPHPQTQDECERIVKAAADRGFRLYAMKVKTGWEAPDLSAFDRLAEAGNGAVLEIDVRHSYGLGLQDETTGRGKFHQRAIPAGPFGAQLGMGNGPFDGGAGSEPGGDLTPGAKLVTRVLSDAINPQYADRVQPIAAILWQSLKEPVPERHEMFDEVRPEADMGQHHHEAFDPQRR